MLGCDTICCGEQKQGPACGKQMGLRIRGHIFLRAGPKGLCSPETETKPSRPFLPLQKCLRVGCDWGERGGQGQTPWKLKEKGGEALRWAQRARGPLGEGV